MKKIALITSFVIAISCLVAGSADADTQFKKAMQKHYDLKSVSCYACHVRKEKKTVRNAFGSLIAKELEGKNASARIKAAKKMEDKEAKAAEIEKVVYEFLEALKVVEAMDAGDGKTNKDLILAGELEGVKLK